jgi:hypothetical protein
MKSHKFRERMSLARSTWDFARPFEFAPLSAFFSSLRAVGDRLCLAIAFRVCTVDRFRLAPIIAAALMLHHHRPITRRRRRIVDADDACSQRPDMQTHCAIHAMNVRSRVVSYWRHRRLRGTDRHECGECGGCRAARSLVDKHGDPFRVPVKRIWLSVQTSPDKDCSSRLRFVPPIAPRGPHSFAGCA